MFGFQRRHRLLGRAGPQGGVALIGSGRSAGAGGGEFRGGEQRAGTGLGSLVGGFVHQHPHPGCQAGERGRRPHAPLQPLPSRPGFASPDRLVSGSRLGRLLYDRSQVRDDVVDHLAGDDVGVLPSGDFERAAADHIDCFRYARRVVGDPLDRRRRERRAKCVTVGAQHRGDILAHFMGRKAGEAIHSAFFRGRNPFQASEPSLQLGFSGEHDLYRPGLRFVRWQEPGHVRQDLVGESVSIVDEQDKGAHSLRAHESPQRISRPVGARAVHRKAEFRADALKELVAGAGGGAGVTDTRGALQPRPHPQKHGGLTDPRRARDEHQRPMGPEVVHEVRFDALEGRCQYRALR